MPDILLIEETPELAQAILTHLRQNEYTVFHAAEGLKGLELHEAHHPDLVILDQTLPDLEGFEVLQWLRQLAGPQVLMLVDPRRPDGGDDQADDSLDKPVNLDNLLQKVRNLLERAGSHPGGGRLVCGPLELEPGTYRAQLQGVPLELARAEFDLVHLMVMSPGRVFSRETLVKTIWDGHYEPGNRSIDNLVLRLRKKLGPFGGRIESVWGEGYRLLVSEKQPEMTPRP